MNYTPILFSINVNFLDDICKKIDDAFQQSNTNVPPEISGKEKIESYIDWQHKTIPSKKRLFHISDQILQNIDSVKAINAIKNDSIKGNSLFKYQSRAVRDAFNKKGKFKHDSLLNDWIIHHFHLGTNTENDGFVTRTENHLYAIVTDSDIFAICICPHGSYSNPKALAIIRNNWPHLFKKIYSPTTSDNSMSSDGNSIKIMRKKKASFPLNIGGDTINSGSTTASGASISSVIKSSYVLYKIQELERNITREFILKNIPANKLHIAIRSADIKIAPEITIDNFITKILNDEYIPMTITLTTY